jgi:hypothetical protein
LYNNIPVLNSIIFLYIYFFKYSYTILTYKKNKLKKNNSLLLIGIVSISLLIIFGAIQSSTAQRYDDDDDDDHDWDRDKWNRHDNDDDDDDDHDWDRDKWNRHDDDDDDDDDFKLTVRLVSDEERERSDYKVKVSGETKSIDGEEFEDDGKASVKFYLDDVDNKERVCITNERNDDETCKKFNTDGDEGTVKFDIG